MTGERKGFCFTMQQEEIWKDIPEYEGLYQASNLGRVKGLRRDVPTCYGKNKTVSERICKPTLHNNGYVSVLLSKDGVKKMISVHRLVAEAFLPNPDNLPQVNHKDENKQNNAVVNLEWCTASHNINYGTRNQKVANKRSRKVKCYSLDGELINVYNGITESMRNLKLPTHAISLIIKCCKGKVSSAYGYKWEYAE